MGGARWDAITTGLVGTTILAVAMLLMIASRGQLLTIAAFILFFGIGSGVLSTIRATMPLIFYDPTPIMWSARDPRVAARATPTVGRDRERDAWSRGGLIRTELRRPPPCDVDLRL
ncbi:hypothetical protein EAS62_39700 [Bradyrhizobium zhanjiangense]|uniref:Membrane transport protein MMPL domain-containing protein n=1 Tax=Bradyrhizobium zhanjiangense TaxID=1325107 RepID=A0ABY0D8F3_9BRAD|nr:hypothetical protein EAS62_39700 [Bradyrhizobium zhanjiangense]